MPISVIQATVIDGASDQANLRLMVSGVLTGATVIPETGTVYPPTFIRLVLNNRDRTRNHTLNYGYAQSYGVLQGVYWNGRLPIPKDYEHVVEATVRNFSGADQQWVLWVTTEDRKDGH